MKAQDIAKKPWAKATAKQKKRIKKSPFPLRLQPQQMIEAEHDRHTGAEYQRTAQTREEFEYQIPTSDPYWLLDQSKMDAEREGGDFAAEPLGVYIGLM